MTITMFAGAQAPALSLPDGDDGRVCRVIEGGYTAHIGIPVAEFPPAAVDEDTAPERATLGPDEIAALVAACLPDARRGGSKKVSGLRARALLAAAYWACARTAELLALAVEDFDESAGTLTIRAQETLHHGTRVVQLPTEAIVALATWLAARPDTAPADPLFCKLPIAESGPEPMTQVHMTFRHLREKAGVSAQVTPGALRIARARALALQGVGLETISELLDHRRTRQAMHGFDLILDLGTTRQLVASIAPAAPCLTASTREDNRAEDEHADAAESVDRRRLAILTPEYRLGKPPANAGRRFPPEVLTPKEVRGLMTHCGRGRGNAFLRNRAWIALSAATGLRVAESLDLLPSDVDWEHGIVHVREGKNRRARRVGIDDDSLAVVAEWRDVRAGLGVHLGTPLFCTFARDEFGPVGRPMWDTQVRTMLKRAASYAGIEKRVHTHALRHTFAMRLMLARVDLLTISILMGHKSTAYTDAYLRHIAPLREVKELRSLPRPEWLDGPICPAPEPAADQNAIGELRGLVARLGGVEQALALLGEPAPVAAAA